jgi:hypothetical protein
MRQVMPHRNNMCAHRSKGKHFLGVGRGVSERCDDFATRVSPPQILVL